MNRYPYYIIVATSGRLPTPIQYKHTPIEKMFKSGKIGGKNVQEIKLLDPKETQLQALQLERQGKQVEVLKVERPNSPRIRCPNWKSRLWQN